MITAHQNVRVGSNDQPWYVSNCAATTLTKPSTILPIGKASNTVRGTAAYDTSGKLASGQFKGVSFDQVPSLLTAQATVANYATKNHRGLAYYQYPFYDTSSKPDERFPTLFGASATNPVVKNNQYLRSDDGLFGLSLYVYFHKSAIAGSLRVDYRYANENPTDTSNPAVTIASGVNPPVKGKVVEGSTTSASTVSIVAVQDGGTDNGKFSKQEVKLVRVTDMTADRLWDSMYQGVTRNFLTATDKLHTCSKRGICDTSTGLCSCFSGFSGLACTEQNALAN